MKPTRIVDLSHKYKPSLEVQHYDNGRWLGITFYRESTSLRFREDIRAYSPKLMRLFDFSDLCVKD